MLNEKEVAVAVGRAIARERSAVGKTPKVLAEEIGTDPSQISRWENGHVLPRLTWLLAIAGALGCPVQALVPSPEYRDMPF